MQNTSREKEQSNTCLVSIKNKKKFQIIRAAPEDLFCRSSEERDLWELVKGWNGDDRPQRQSLHLANNKGTWIGKLGWENPCEVFVWLGLEVTSKTRGLKRIRCLGYGHKGLKRRCNVWIQHSALYTAEERL